MVRNTGQADYERVVRALPLVAGVCFLACAGLCSRTVADWFDTEPPLTPKLIFAIESSQAVFLLLAGGLLLLGFLLPQSRAFDRIVQGRVFQRLSLSAFLILTPLIAVEVGFRPIAAVQRWNLYCADAQRGWKHRPNTTDYLVQLPVRINNLGLRGSVIEQVKPPQTHRILFLGDSVIFGQGIPTEAETIPQQVAAMLRSNSAKRVEAVNAGVCGYSPWQEYNYLLEEGVGLSPDLVVTNFVLNDVTEKFNLPRFGGSHPNDQLVAAATSAMPAWILESGLYYVTKELAARLRFGWSPHQAATQEEMLGVVSLSDKPDDPTVQYAWRVTLENLRKIIRTTEEASAENLLVVYPYRFQLDREETAPPQEILTAFAEEEGVPMLDLLPVYRSAMRQQGITAGDLFLDWIHPSPLGDRISAEAIADFIDTHPTLTLRPHITDGVVHASRQSRNNSDVTSPVPFRDAAQSEVCDYFAFTHR